MQIVCGLKISTQMMKTFNGYLREDGSVGTRNYIAVIPTVFCANEVASQVAEESELCRPVLHNKGCAELKPDLKVVTRTLIGLGLNPNVGAVLLVSLGCEAVSADEVYQGIFKEKKWIEKLVIQQTAGMRNTIKEGRRIVAEMSDALSKQDRSPQPAKKIRLAVKCGSSDATSGIAANPATGKAVDFIIEQGGTAVFGETTEFIGAEHILAKRGRRKEVEGRIMEIVSRMEKRIIQLGVDMRGSQPTPGNIAGGLTTIDVVFTSGGGAPQGTPLVPVIKVASNPQMVHKMEEHVDVDASTIVTGTKSINDVSQLIIERIFRVASGSKVAAEINHYDKSIGIYTTGPTV